MSATAKNGLSKLLNESIKRSSEIIYEKKELTETQSNTSSHIMEQSSAILSKLSKNYKKTFANEHFKASIQTSKCHSGTSYPLSEVGETKNIKEQVEWVLNYCADCAYMINVIYGHIARLELIYNKLVTIDAPHRIKIAAEITSFSDKLGRWTKRILGVESELMKIGESCLSPDEIGVLTKRYFEGWKFPEVAKHLFISDKTVFSVRKRLVNQLTTYFTKNGITNVPEALGFDHKYFDD